MTPKAVLRRIWVGWVGHVVRIAAVVMAVAACAALRSNRALHHIATTPLGPPGPVMAMAARQNALRSGLAAVHDGVGLLADGSTTSALPTRVQIASLFAGHV